jgi:hypothetical protein
MLPSGPAPAPGGLPAESLAGPAEVIPLVSLARVQLAPPAIGGSVAIPGMTRRAACSFWRRSVVISPLPAVIVQPIASAHFAMFDTTEALTLGRVLGSGADRTEHDALVEARASPTTIHQGVPSRVERCHLDDMPPQKSERYRFRLCTVCEVTPTQDVDAATAMFPSMLRFQRQRQWSSFRSRSCPAYGHQLRQAQSRYLSCQHILVVWAGTQGEHPLRTTCCGGRSNR